MSIWNIEYLNRCSQIAYPFTNDSSLVDITGTITLPTTFILEMQLPIHSGLDVTPDGFYLQSLIIAPTGYTLTIGYNDGSSSPPLVATVGIAAATHVENTTYALPGANNFADTVGQIVIGVLTDVALLPPGQYNFSPTAANIETDCIRPMIRGITSITLVNGSDRTAPIYGDIELVAGSNMQITANTIQGANPQIVFSAISGAGLNSTCVCTDQAVGTPITSINGIQPDANGTFHIIGNNCMSVAGITNGLMLTDTCSAPCVGCTELQALYTQAQRFADGVATLQNFVNNLGAQVMTMGNVVLGSTLRDGGCVQCG